MSFVLRNSVNQKLRSRVATAKPEYIYDGWYHAYLKAEWHGFGIDCDVFEADTDLIEGLILDYLEQFYTVIDPATGKPFSAKEGE